jgi:YjbE family integral membrane protein
MLELLSAIGSIILVDLVLSGDNALVIGAAASSLPRRQRWMAIAIGGGGAIVLRIIFAIIATFLLRLPLLQAVGGILLLIIAIRLLMDRNKDEHLATEHAQNEENKSIQESAATSSRAQGETVERGLWAALFTILVADVTMSLDNVLAIGALAAGNLPILAIGLVLSILFLLLGSALVAELIGRLPWLLDVAALVLAWTAANMILDDLRLGPILEHYSWTHYAIPAATFAIVIAADILLRLRDRQEAEKKTALATQTPVNSEREREPARDKGRE